MHPLSLVSALCLSLSAVRAFWQNENLYLFLVWNLFLAAIPYLATKYLDTKAWFKSLLVMGISILFLPNAAYLVTDFVHFRHGHRGANLWYDLVLFFSYGLAGILFTYYAIQDLGSYVRRQFGNWLYRAFLALVFPAIGYGIYLGRIERYNSWDLVLHPFSFARGMWGILTGPELFPAIRFSLLFAFFAALLHYILLALHTHKQA